MKRKLIAAFLALCMLASLAVTASAAAYDGQVNVELIIDAGKKLFSTYEGVYDTVVPNDCGAVGMGIMGWRGPKALQLMKMICKAAPELSREILGDSFYYEIVNAGDTAWNSRTFTSSEAARAKQLLGTEYGIAAQEELARMDITRQIGEAWGQGVRTEAAILYYCSISNHYGPGGAQKFMTYIRATMGITTSDTINSLQEFHSAVVEAAKTYSYVNSTLSYRTKVYNYIKNTLGWNIYGPEASPVTQEPEPEPPQVCENCPSAGFTDVPPKGHWAHDGIDYVLENGLFQGTSATTFSPDAYMTRAMLVTVLYRMEGSPEGFETTPFADVSEDSYYVSAVAWAAENGIVKGVSETSFAPDNVVTREQLATILFRYSSYKSGANVETDCFVLDGYGDSPKVSDFAREAMAWAVNCGLIRGDTTTGDLLLNPTSCATRAQVAVILMRYREG